MDNRTRKMVGLVAEAAYTAATKEIERLRKVETFSEDEVPAYFGGGLLWATLSFVYRVGMTRPDFLEMAKKCWELVKEESENTAN